MGQTAKGKKKYATVPIDLLRELLNYDPETGVFTWRASRKQANAGDVVGTVAEGYVRINIYGVVLRANRVAIAITTGEWPEGDVDHADTDSTNNRLSNLRVATRSQNCANAKRKSRNTSGYKGVSFCKKKHQWRAYVTVGGKQSHLGYFDSPEEAHAAYYAAAREHFGEFARAA